MVELTMLATFLVTLGLVFWVGRMVLKLHQDPIRQRLAAAAGSETRAGSPAPAGGALTQSLAVQLPQLSFGSSELDKDLRRAGYYRPTAHQEYLAIRNALVILVVVITGTLAVVVGPGRQDVVLRILGVGLAVAVLSFSLPKVLVAFRARQRVRRICRSLPDGLDMISMCLGGGLSMQDSLANVSPEIFAAHSDLAVELMIIRQQAEMSSLEFAIEKFAERIDAPETVSMAALITQNQRLGTSVANSIRQYADSMRSTRRQTADERSGKLQVKLLFPVICCFLPSVIILLWGSAILELWSFFQELPGQSLAP